MYLLIYVILIYFSVSDCQPFVSGNGSLEIYYRNLESPFLYLLRDIQNLQRNFIEMENLFNSVFSQNNPDGLSWYRLNNSCYMRVSKKQNLTDSEKYCINQGGYLAELLAEEEKISIVSIIAGTCQSTDCGEKYWIRRKSISIKPPLREEICTADGCAASRNLSIPLYSICERRFGPKGQQNGQ